MLIALFIEQCNYMNSARKEPSGASFNPAFQTQKLMGPMNSNQ